ncbi:hypothetical protein BN7_5498 [Wickerhamomyces ciferrii]|uniref:Amidase domain-containing protein n=1 Tax=Wickerhamomyces ciferrii (strain ATCC 14091 / BCRC 22168 / CBS 111 / JCM 3599 / NBRC 0793 / NRRL Y-1031 F-60-10) TaxID=1206466 RepID=K0KRY6_WICCF|nr:uncharacterized protein BN7_5498 [Wickerhamomyces ciferrii]CCH45911.1 hypothetical protein BN7_5498 [Wickerhamomyces ciferrii]
MPAKIFSVDHSKEPLLTSLSAYKGDKARYEKEWVPKIKAYNKKLNDAIPKEYLAPESLVPADLDNAAFNATTVPEKVLDDQSIKITNLTATEIATKVAKRELTSLEVITAFIKRATIAHQLTHCAMEILFDDGIERAKYLDDYIEKNGRTVGPLHGVPVSLKEHYDFKDHVTHAGFVGSLDRVATEFSVTNQILYDQGAVFYIRTTEPQSLMHLDSINNITGRGRNAYNISLSPGGSTSGEAPLIALKGSPLGVGSDIGGSIRGPAAFNNIWGLKPSTKRLSLVGCYSASYHTFQESIGAVLGPMSNSVEDLELFMKSYLGANPWEKDQYCIPIPWREVSAPKAHDLTIGIVYDDGVVKPHPPVLRALKEVENKLKASGVNVVTWDSHRVYEACEVVNALYTADGNYAAIGFLDESGEPLAPLSEHFLRAGKGDRGLTVIENQYYNYTREILRHEYSELFKKRGVDYIIAPTYVGTAPRPSLVKYWGYTSLWNILDQTCVTFPSGVFGDKSIDKKDLSYKPRNKYEEFEYNLYDEDDSDGMPVGLTLVGKRYTEEESLKAAKVISDILKV